MNHKRLLAKFEKDYNGTGNVVSYTQLSGFVRPFNATECNGFAFPAGHLRDSDMGRYKFYDVPYAVKEILKNNPDTTYCLYVIRDSHRGSMHQHGVVLTECTPRNNRYDERVVFKMDYRKAGVVDYFCNLIGVN